MKVNPHARFVFWALIAICIATASMFISAAQAQGLKELPKDTLVKGTIFICKTAEDATDVATVEVTEGLEKAQELFEKKKGEGKCVGSPAVFTPRKLISTAKGKHGTTYVIEIEAYGGTYYLLAEIPLVEALKKKGIEA